MSPVYSRISEAKSPPKRRMMCCLETAAIARLTNGSVSAYGRSRSRKPFQPLSITAAAGAMCSATVLKRSAWYDNSTH